MPPKSGSPSKSPSPTPSHTSTESALDPEAQPTPPPTPTSTPLLSPPRSPTGFTPTPGSSPSLSPPFWIPRWRRNPRPPRSRSRTPPPHLPQRPTLSPDSGPWSGYHPGVRTPSFTSYPATPRTTYLGSPSTWWSPVTTPKTPSSKPDPSPPLSQRSPTEMAYILASPHPTTPTPPSPSSSSPYSSSHSRRNGRAEAETSASPSY